MEAESVADIAEQDLARRLYNDPMFRAKILPHDCGEHWHRLEVPYALLVSDGQRAVGEVDLVVVPTATAPNAIAIELKRVKVTSATFTTGRANKIKELRKLAEQANRLVELGFHRVGATVLVLVDARGDTSEHRWFVEAPDEVRREIDSVIAAAGFSPAVMLDVLEIRQPEDVDFRLRGSTTLRPIQPGEQRPQHDGLSSRIIELFELSGE